MHSNSKMLTVTSKFDYDFRVNFYLSDFCNGRPLSGKILSDAVASRRQVHKKNGRDVSLRKYRDAK